MEKLIILAVSFSVFSAISAIILTLNYFYLSWRFCQYVEKHAYKKYYDFNPILDVFSEGVKTSRSASHSEDTTEESDKKLLMLRNSLRIGTFYCLLAFGCTLVSIGFVFFSVMITLISRNLAF